MKLIKLFKSIFIVFVFATVMHLKLLRTAVFGTNTTVVRQLTRAVFTPGANLVTGVTSIQGGWVFQGVATGVPTCTWKCLLPIYGGRLQFFGGQLSLSTDIRISGTSTSITSSGSILANRNTVFLGPFLSDFTLTPTFVIDTATIMLDENLLIYGSLRLRNSCKINARGKRIAFQGNGELDVLPGGKLTIENAEIVGVKKNNLRCFSDRGAIAFRNCSIYLAQDYTFSSGSFCVDDTLIVTGTNKFIYSSGLTSTIGSSALMYLDFGITLSYQPRVANNSLLFMVDNTSKLYCNGCTLYSTRTGLMLSTGTLILDDSVTFSSEARSMSEAMILSSNLTAKVLGRASLDLYGLIRYD